MLSALLVLFVLCLAAPLAAGAGTAAGSGSPAPRAIVPLSLLEAATANPDQQFKVIVQGARGESSADVERHVADEAGSRSLQRQFRSVAGVAAELTGRQLVKLAHKSAIAAITPDAPVRLSGLASKQKWPYVVGAAKYWAAASAGTLRAPTIAIVDSGVDATHPDLAGRVVEQVNLTRRLPNSPGDGRGHGTFVASIAAGNGASYVGAAPSAKIVSVDVVDDAGVALTSDVIAGADWILANKGRLGIRVANFSLHSLNPANFTVDPLDRAVERLWHSGVVVVAAAGNYGSPTKRGVPYAPGNDPFVITVGASDVDGSVGVRDDFEAPWSAFGYTLDGFAKPEVGAPGRYMVGAVPATATLARERPDRMVDPRHLQLSGTSFSAPVVAGAASVLLALHPTWTPDQVKGALMLTVKATPAATPRSLGVGEIDLARAADVILPPNPNAALNRFLVADPTGGSTRVFDAASWTDVARSNASWTDASWTDASWLDASWTDASWTDASWTDASWTDASWTDASWLDVSQSDASWVSNAEDDAIADGGYWVAPAEVHATELELATDLDGDGLIGPPPTLVTAPALR